MTNTPTPAQQELVTWWLDTAGGDIDSSIDKIVEYGGSGPAVDLIEVGRRLADLGNLRGQTIEELTELGIAFYLSSKVSRWFAAIKEGRRPSDDTLLDIVYYGMMARRNRAVGGWPVGPIDRPPWRLSRGLAEPNASGWPTTEPPPRVQFVDGDQTVWRWDQLNKKWYPVGSSLCPFADASNDHCTGHDWSEFSR